MTEKELNIKFQEYSSIDELPKEVKETLKIEYMKSADDAIKIALVK